MGKMTERFTGTIGRGQGGAHVNFKVMIPPVALYFPDVAKCDQFGTINVDLHRPLDKNHADCWTPPIGWSPITWNEPNRLETFGFTKIKLELPQSGQMYDAWMIIPDGNMLSYRGNRVEIISDVWIPDAQYDATCVIHLDHIPLIPRPDWFGKYFERLLNASGIFKDSKGLFLHPFKS